MFQLNILPRLPWFNFNDKKVGCERWHKRPTLGLLNGEIPCLLEQRHPENVVAKPFTWDPAPGNYAPLYPAKNGPELASWIVYDKQVLCFDAYFRETPIESRVPVQIRRVKIVYFLEDGTIQVNEAKIDNSGLSQGTIIHRQRIPFSRPMEKAFYEIIDFNINKTVVLFAREFHIIDCDKFTRQWLNRTGIAVPDPLPPPHDPFAEELLKRKTIMSGKRKCAPRNDKFRKFLDYDRHILRFYGYWDDRGSEGGDLHKIILQYYLADDTIDVREEGGGFTLVRSRLPKFSGSSSLLLPPGATEPVTVLNILNNRVAADPLNIGANRVDYYKDDDLSIGTVVNVYGRAVLLTSCDLFTTDYYQTKYGLQSLGEPIPLPEDCNVTRCAKDGNWQELPPYNGFGTFEDSARNCLKLIPQGNDVRSVTKKLANFSNGLESRILRFCAAPVPEDPQHNGKHFIICFYIADDTVSIYQIADRNSGLMSGKVFQRREAWKSPVADFYVRQKPATFQKEDFWVGNIVTVDHQTYQLLEADEYTLRHMENSQEFPKSNIELILPKIRKKLRPIYKEFTCKYLLPNGASTITHGQLWDALRALLGEDVTPQEMLTVARHFAVQSPRQTIDKCTLREISRNECRRLLFNDQERLAENLKYRDMAGTGYLSPQDAYSTCRGAKVPLDSVVVKLILNAVDKNERGEVNIADLLSFFNPAGLPTTTFIPFSHLAAFSELSLMAEHPDYSTIDSFKLLESLNLEEGLKKES